MNRRSLLIRTAALASVLGGAWWARDHLLWPKPELAFAAGGATPWMPYGRRGPAPTVAVRLGGRQVVALIDSGAQYSVIDRALFAELPDTGRSLFDMPLVAYGVGGGAQVGRGTALDVELAGLVVKGLRAAILDLGPLASRQGLGTPLILGQDLLGEAVLALDPARRHSRLVAREAFVRPADLAETPVRRSGRALTAEVTVEGTLIEAVVDTGASSLLGLNRETAARAGLLDGRPRTSGVHLVLGGSARTAIVEARTVTFADHLYRRVPVGVFDQPPLPNFPGGLVGMEAFAGRRVAMDLGAGTLHVSRPLDLTVG
ncbi:aspartyl protease family protein [Brevundimonas sp. BR2-1]|uniref:aspartyl protease family protein n=1 Tax=unclassified Brevundimonas TaxID=2622653 RepID=UPI002FCA3514